MVPQWVPLKKQLEFRKAREDLCGGSPTSWSTNGVANPVENGEDVLSRLIASGSEEAMPVARNGCATSWSPCCWPGTRRRRARWAGRST